MADTFHEIYRNASFGATQLDDGEETILTTNSTTSYVIKDMYVNGTSSLSNTYLELNGFKVANITSNATGSLIIPPNSTLKIKSTDYPYTFKKDIVKTMGSNGQCFLEDRYYLVGDEDNYTVGATVATTNNFSSYKNDTIKLNYNVANNGTGYWYMMSHDNNSVQTVYRMTNTGSPSQVIYQNYVANGTGRMINGDFIGFTTSSSNFYKVDLDASPTAGFTATLNHSSISPYPTSSYPRHFFFKDHLWYIPSSGYNGNVYAYNFNTGSVKQYYNMASITTSGHNHICVSHDERDDKLYIWRGSSGDLYKAELNHTLTQLTALASTSSSYVIPSETHYSSLNTSVSTANGLYSNLQPTSNGGIRYTGTTADLITLDINGEEVGDPIVRSSFTVAGNTSYKDYIELETITPTSSELSTYNVSAPTFGIQLLGVKST